MSAGQLRFIWHPFTQIKGKHRTVLNIGHCHGNAKPILIFKRSVQQYDTHGQSFNEMKFFETVAGLRLHVVQ